MVEPVVRCASCCKSLTLRSGCAHILRGGRCQMRSFRNRSMGCVLAGALLGAGCSMLGIGKAGPESVALHVTPNQPAAQGTVNVGAEKDGNRTIEVRVQHLSPPERAMPGARTYVVWLVPRAGGVPQNMGVLTLQRSEEHTSELQSQSNLVCRL